MSKATRIQALKDGPYLVRGPVTIVDPHGGEVLVAEGKNAALCRCGASANKPFCDGTHSSIGFSAAEAAPGSDA